MYLSLTGISAVSLPPDAGYRVRRSHYSANARLADTGRHCPWEKNQRKNTGLTALNLLTSYASTTAPPPKETCGWSCRARQSPHSFLYRSVRYVHSVLCAEQMDCAWPTPQRDPWIAVFLHVYR